MNVRLSEESRRFVAHQVASGRYPSEDAVLEDAVSRMRRQEQAPATGRTLDTDPLWGLFRDQPELIDRVVDDAMLDRRTLPLRATPDE